MCMFCVSIVSYGCVDLWFFFVKQRTAYEMRISDWSSDVCSSDLHARRDIARVGIAGSQRDDRRRLDVEPGIEECAREHLAELAAFGRGEQIADRHGLDQRRLEQRGLAAVVAQQQRRADIGDRRDVANARLLIAGFRDRLLRRRWALHLRLGTGSLRERRVGEGW